MTKEIVAAVVGGFLGWVIIQSVQYFVLGYRLRRYLVTQINHKLRALKQNQIWLKEVEKTNVKEGFVIERAADYTMDKLKELTEVRELTMKYLQTTELDKLTKLTAIINRG